MSTMAANCSRHDRNIFEITFDCSDNSGSEDDFPILRDNSDTSDSESDSDLESSMQVLHNTIDEPRPGTSGDTCASFDRPADYL